jgi:hypothetical protein
MTWLLGRIFEGSALDRILKAFSPESVFCTLSAALARGFVVVCFMELLLNGFIVEQYWQFCKEKKRFVYLQGFECHYQFSGAVFCNRASYAFIQS